LKDVADSLARLEDYLLSWTDEDGGVHGYIIHHHRDYAVITAPASWTQGLRVLGHLQLYEKTGDGYWLESALRESRFLEQAYCWEEHLFYDSTTPLTLINNAWPTLALLRTALLLRRRGRDGYLGFSNVALDNLEKRMIRLHWDPSARTFFFCPEGYWGMRVHTHNQTAIAISALCAADQLADEKSYVERYAIPAADHMIRLQEPSGILRGGWGYNDGDSSHLYYYLYTALNVRGLLDLYEHTGESRFLESAALGGEHLYGMIDGQTSLFCHRYVKKGRRVERYVHPIMVATAGLGLLQLRRLNGYGFSFKLDGSVDSLLGRQLPHGGFPSFIGSTDIWTPGLFPSEPERTKWRDVTSVPFWNVFTYELLVDLLEAGSKIRPPRVEFRFEMDTDDGYRFEETRSRVRLSRSGRTVAYFDKTRDFMLFSTERMRGVPFGAFANTEHAVIQKLRRRVRRLAALGAAVWAATVLVLLFL